MADCYLVESRSKHLFIRTYKEEEKVNITNYKPITRVANENSSIENAIDLC